jgi:hypothetical protein
MRVDSYMVKGNATLFDGSVVETGQATADLRMNKGTEITMSTSSRGTLYRDRLVLQRGESELAANSSFQLEANGLRVTPNEPNSRGVVSMKAKSTVEVAALTGSFGVTNDQGVLLASVRPGQTISFAMQAGGTPTSFSGTGVVSFEDGHYILTTSPTPPNVRVEITGKNLRNFVGKKVNVSGTTQMVAGKLIVSVTSIGINGAVGMSAASVLMISGVGVGTASAVAVAINKVNQSSTPASR